MEGKNKERRSRSMPLSTKILQPFFCQRKSEGRESGAWREICGKNGEQKGREGGERYHRFPTQVFFFPSFKLSTILQGPLL
jgi:hypothetical protein